MQILRKKRVVKKLGSKMDILNNTRKTCIISCIFGEKFKTLYKSLKDYDSYVFTNNHEIEAIIENNGWKYIFVDFPLSEDDAVSSFQSKYIKFLQFLKENRFSFFKKYNYIIYIDHKLELKKIHVRYLINFLQEKEIIIRNHHENRRNIWEEVGMAMFQERYLRFMPQTIDYIREKIKEGYSDKPDVVWTSLIAYKSQEKEVLDFVDKIYNDLKRIGTSECQIVWSMLGQKYGNIIKIIKWNEMAIKWEIPSSKQFRKNAVKIITEIQNKIKDRKIYMWGTGRYALRILNLLEKNHIKIKAFLDSNKELQGHTFMDYKIYKPEKILTHKENILIVIASEIYCYEIAGICKNYGLKKNKDFLYPGKFV